MSFLIRIKSTNNKIKDIKQSENIEIKKKDSE